MSETCGFWYKSCCIPGRLDGKVAIVTGADGGLGFYITTELARRGATVVMACLDMDEGEQAKSMMLGKYGLSNPRSTEQDIACEEMKTFLSPISSDQLIVQQLDLASLASVRNFVRTFQTNNSQLHYLINNAGLVSLNYKTTKDGFEMTIGVNHLGHFLLTELLLTMLKQSAPSRIIFTSSDANNYGRLNKPDLLLTPRNYRPLRAYAQSKLANVTYACELARRLAGTGVLTASVHPGMMRTNIGKEMNLFHHRLVGILVRPLCISPWQGIQTTILTVLSPNLQSGGYYSKCIQKVPSRIALDEHT